MGKCQSKSRHIVTKQHTQNKQNIATEVCENFAFNLENSVFVKNLYELNISNTFGIQLIKNLEILLYDFIDFYIDSALKKLSSKYVCIHGGKAFDMYFYNPENEKSFCYDIVTNNKDFPKLFTDYLNTKNSSNLWQRKTLNRFLVFNKIINPDSYLQIINEQLFFYGLRDDNIMSVYIRLPIQENTYITPNHSDGNIYLTVANIFRNRIKKYEIGMTYLPHIQHYLPEDQDTFERIAYAKPDILLLEMIIHKNICNNIVISNKIEHKLSYINSPNTKSHKFFITKMNNHDSINVTKDYDFSEEYAMYVDKINKLQNLAILEMTDSTMDELGNDFFVKTAKIELSNCDVESSILEYTEEFSGPINKLLQTLNIVGHKFGMSDNPSTIVALYDTQLKSCFVGKTNEDIMGYIKKAQNLLMSFNKCNEYQLSVRENIKHEYFYVYSGQAPFYFLPKIVNKDQLGLIFRKGSIIFLPQFLSTSLNPNVAYNFYKNHMGSVIFKIKINKKNNNWLLIDEYSAHSDEQEILLKCGSYLSVTNVYHTLIRNEYHYAGCLAKIVECELADDLNEAIDIHKDVDRTFLLNLNFNRKLQTAGAKITNIPSVLIFPNGFVDTVINNNDEYIQWHENIYNKIDKYINFIFHKQIQLQYDIFVNHKLNNLLEYENTLLFSDIKLKTNNYAEMLHIQQQELQKLHPIDVHVGGNYYQKYLKYKNKYVNLSKKK